MTENKLRNRISRFIIVSNSVLFLTIIIYYILTGFDDEEIVILIGYLTPITAVYMGALVKFAVANKNVVKENTINIKEKEVNKLYITITNWAIPAHFILIFAIINFAAFNLIAFEQLKILFVITETAFGAYIGIIMSSLFKVDEI